MIALAVRHGLARIARHRVDGAIGSRDDAELACGLPEKRVIVRFHSGSVDEVVAALEAAGCRVLERVDAQPAALAA